MHRESKRWAEIIGWLSRIKAGSTLPESWPPTRSSQGCYTQFEHLPGGCTRFLQIVCAPTPSGNANSCLPGQKQRSERVFAFEMKNILLTILHCYYPSLFLYLLQVRNRFLLPHCLCNSCCICVQITGIWAAAISCPWKIWRTACWSLK